MIQQIERSSGRELMTVDKRKTERSRRRRRRRRRLRETNPPPLDLGCVFLCLSHLLGLTDGVLASR